MASLPSCNCEQSTCASYLCACKIRGEYCNDFCFCSGRACSNRVDGLLLHSPRITPNSSPHDLGYLARTAALSASAPISPMRNWDSLSQDVFGSPLQIQASVFSNTHLSRSVAVSSFGSPGSPPLSPSKNFLRNVRKKQVSALNIPRTPEPSPTSVPWGSPTSFRPAHMQPRFHFNTATHGAQPDQYDADRAIFLQYYMIIAEEFLYAFLEAWHTHTLPNLNLFRETSELGMDDQLYLGPDCLDRLCEETSQISPNYVEVMPSKEGFDIGVAVTGDLKSALGLLSTFTMEIVLKNDGSWYIYSMKAV